MMKITLLCYCTLVSCLLIFGLSGCGSSTSTSTPVSSAVVEPVDNSSDVTDEGSQWEFFDFSSPVTINAVHIAFNNGNQRSNHFTLDSSNDNQTWTTQLDTVSAVNSTEFETFNLADKVTARYFRIVGLDTSNDQSKPVSAVKFTAQSEQGSDMTPARIEAEDYSSAYDSTSGNQGGEYRTDDVDIVQTSDVSGDYHIDLVTDTEWLEYAINVGSSGEYTADLRIASGNGGGAIAFFIDGFEKAMFTVPATVQWETKTINLGYLTSGQHTLKLAFSDGDFELNWLELAKTRGQLAQLDSSLAPAANFDLSDWYLGVPIDENGDGKSDSISERELAAGYQHPQWFYTADDGAMVFKVAIDAPKTSANTSYSRSELREMLRAGDTSIRTQGVNKNNWVFSTYSSDDKEAAGGIDGELIATLKVDHVTTTGDSSQVGRVIIGQIHAKDDEPARLYYRKLKDNSKGSIYLAHEPNGGSDQLYNMIGSSSSTAVDPVDGIALGETFTYSIKVTGNTLLVTIMREGKADVSQRVDMSNSGYHTGDDQYMYFKAGVYNQNNTGDPNDYVQASFYSLTNSHY
ncbi:polysaccharide lyase family 7 protein [Pseudoalteromonas shioyasakiensis]|uniref:polysaccharide lyase family 7 protein n=1 Tax=Pseudoalteromonas shioyasakiensis TaxID=1190813 RepID=UPI0021179B7B|nr:polysaccharide lyase family 7 protein [Pseudoalteromonas shioyasakiensis]MCQ8878331.1 polysaccharide lyase family 7 protein [Pseudoalteromonas shioyasakiensis]